MYLCLSSLAYAIEPSQLHSPCLISISRPGTRKFVHVFFTTATIAPLLPSFFYVWVFFLSILQCGAVIPSRYISFVLFSEVFFSLQNFRSRWGPLRARLTFARCLKIGSLQPQSLGKNGLLSPKRYPLFTEEGYNPFTPKSDQQNNFPCSLTRNITSHSTKNLSSHCLLRWSKWLYVVYQFRINDLKFGVKGSQGLSDACLHPDAK